MRRSNPSTEPDDGSASIEFLVAGLLLLVPVVYLVVTLGLVQSHAFGADAAARHLARSIAVADGDIDGHIARVVQTTAADYGIDPADISVRVRCAPADDGCPAPGAVLTATVQTRVVLPLVPPVFGWEDLAALPIEASAVQLVSAGPGR
ncbi:MAG: TadE family protein [Microbacterium ginsengisoli]|nr:MULTISPECIES: hypothetical protein [unclassified Microbacterium]KQR91276.1 hypothetical protein ASF93_07980 [Microbacterium sp. Leaf347]KQS01265.1 hypothetical protein ASG00_10805 [Microbacterium sp. Leaf351]MBN9197052.1 TadE family protein [Microbacterium ginsengisoli]OJU77009.1 MAG: hypothetical protein BGO15_05760 [Microbacterium sp. 71-23]